MSITGNASICSVLIFQRGETGHKQVNKEVYGINGAVRAREEKEAREGGQGA